MLYKDLYKKIDKTVRALEVSQDEQEVIRTVLAAVVKEHGEELGVTSGRLYIHEGDHYRLMEQIGESIPQMDNIEFPLEYLPILELRERKYCIATPNQFLKRIRNAENDPVQVFAAIAIGEQDKYLASFSIHEPFMEDHLAYSLNTIRFVTNFKLRELDLQNEIIKAQEIQESLLPDYQVERNGFDIYGRSDPATLVGGDGYDFISINDDALGIAVLDAVGHGLPAALQARDVVTGLRMGMFESIKMETMMYHLNRVIHRSNLSSRFVSMFYGELEYYGHFVYINAGHPPALFFSGGKVEELSRGGMVLGPNPEARYHRGFAYLHPGDILLIYTDGITEASPASGEQYGKERLIKLITEHKSLSAEKLSDLIFKSVTQFSKRTEAQDDQTLVLIKRTSQETNQF